MSNDRTSLRAIFDALPWETEQPVPAETGLWASAKAWDAKASVVFDRLTHSFVGKTSALVVAIVSFIAVADQFRAAEEDRKLRAEERENWRLERIDRARALLRSPTPGDIGKGSALTYLLEQNLTVAGMDLSCSATGGEWKDEHYPVRLFASLEQRVFLEGLPPLPDCARPSLLLNVQFPHAASGTHDVASRPFGGTNMSGVVFKDINIDAVDFETARLKGTRFERGKMTNVNIGGDDADSWFARDVNLSGASIFGGGTAYIFRSQVDNIQVDYNDWTARDQTARLKLGGSRNYAHIDSLPRCIYRVNEYRYRYAVQACDLRTLGLSACVSSREISGPLLDSILGSAEWIDDGNIAPPAEDERDAEEKLQLLQIARPSSLLCNRIYGADDHYVSLNIDQAIELRPKLITGSWRPHP